MGYRIQYPLDLDDDYDQWEIEQKGWLDLTVILDEGELQLSVYDKDRLSIEVQNEFGRLGYFAARNVLIVPRVTRGEIEGAVAKLAARGFSDFVE